MGQCTLWIYCYLINSSIVKRHKHLHLVSDMGASQYINIHGHVLIHTFMCVYMHAWSKRETFPHLCREGRWGGWTRQLCSLILFQLTPDWKLWPWVESGCHICFSDWWWVQSISIPFSPGSDPSWETMQYFFSPVPQHRHVLKYLEIV